MRFEAAIVIGITASAASACEAPVCLVDPDALALTRIITFDESRSSRGPGHQIKDLLVMRGAVFGEHFAGQEVSGAGDHDRITGTALPPLTVMPGADGQNLSIVYFEGNNILNGYGVAGYPKRHAQGEGAISALFDEDQSALAFQIRGGEAGPAKVAFLARDGAVIAELDLPPPGEHEYGFIRAGGTADIAGFLITNEDPQGLAIDNVKFGKTPELG